MKYTNKQSPMAKHYKANYKSKISYYSNKLNLALSEGVETKYMQKYLDSLNYFASKQIEIERMEEQLNEVLNKEPVNEDLFSDCDCHICISGEQGTISDVATPRFPERNGSDLLYEKI